MLFNIKRKRPLYGKETIGGRVFDVFNVIFIFLLTFIMLYPFWNQLIVSFNEGIDTSLGGLYFWPRAFTLDNYAYIFKQSGLTSAAVVSVLRVIVGTSTSVFCTGLLAYITTIKWFSGRKFMRIIFLITMYFGGGLVPTYLLISNLGLMDTFTVYWLPGLFNAYNMLLIASYIYNLPDSLSESARIDGAGEITIFWKIIIPLCLPVIATIALFNAVGHWNSWFDVMIYNSSGNWDTLQVYLRKILLESEQIGKLTNQQQQMEAMRKLTPGSVRAATTMIVTIPIICLYPFLQKYFISGITIGAVKE